MGLGLNLLLRLAIVGFMVDTYIRAGWPQYQGKGLAIRNILVIGLGSLIVPALHARYRRGERYPFTADNLYLSMYVGDMLGNAANIYDRWYWYDWMTHFTGTGAATLALALILAELPATKAAGRRANAWRAWRIANVVHAGLELQEWLPDVFGGTRNVHGMEDAAHDLGMGLLGSTAYLWLGLRRGHEMARGVRQGAAEFRQWQQSSASFRYP
ncbi:MAG TPA: hypothetical protein VF157_05715 [Chloroflexota bacterium]